jgi:hypothetical protein
MIGPNVALRMIGKLGPRRWGGDQAARRGLAGRGGFRIANLGAVATIASTPYSHKRLLTRALKSLDPDTLYAEALALGGIRDASR